MFPATLFDFNGVLVDDEQVHLAAFREVVRPLGIEISEEKYWQELLGFDDAGAFEHLLREAHQYVGKDQVKKLIEDKRPLYRAQAEKELKTFPGAERVVRMCRARGPVAVVSGALTSEIEFGLQRLGVRDLVFRIISAEDTEVSKPDPEGYLMGIEALSAELFDPDLARRALVIEDSLDGIAAAKAAGLATVAVAHSYSREELLETEADLVLSRLSDLTEELLTELYENLYP